MGADQRQKNLMSLMQKKLMNKYYGTAPSPQVAQTRQAEQKSEAVGFFDYTDRGTTEFMRGGC